MINIKNISKKLLTSFIGCLTGFLNGLFGSGGGTIVVIALEKFLHVKAHKAHGTAVFIMLPLSIISAIIYLKDETIPWDIVVLVSIGGLIGGIIGAKLLSKISSKWLHRAFGAFMIIASIKMIT